MRIGVERLVLRSKCSGGEKDWKRVGRRGMCHEVEANVSRR